MNNKNGLQHFYNNKDTIFEIGVDEAGRGPLFGRVYTAAVILPKNDNFKYDLLKDSKKFTSQKKILEAYNYIKNNALFYSVTYNDEKYIDKNNIRVSTMNSMHESIKNVINKINENISNIFIIVDGNDFKPFTVLRNDEIINIPNITIEGGDNKYCSIAAASILAKVERDLYIKDLCNKYNKLNIYYNLEKNKGYGTAQHIEGIKKNGISPWHRVTYGLCKESKINNQDFYL
jgi:ribonuclease HII